MVMYSTCKEVKLLDRRLGALHLIIFSVILAYVVGWRIIAERGYQAVELSRGSVSVQLRGITYSTTPHGVRPEDGASMVRPQEESDAIFIPTRTITTRGQKLDNCTDPSKICAVDSDCGRRPPLAYGLCEQGYCVTLGWCPREQWGKGSISEMTMLQAARTGRLPALCSPLRSPHHGVSSRVRQELERLTVALSADISFPRSGGHVFSTEDGRPARTRWTVAEIVQRSGARLADALTDGLLLSVVVKWSCNLNPHAKECVPALLVHRIGGDAGFSTRWADYYDQRDGPQIVSKRDQHTARGIRLLFSSRGIGKRVDVYACVLQLFVALALLPVRRAPLDPPTRRRYACRTTRASCLSRAGCEDDG